MLRNSIIALVALGVVGAVSPTTASARGGHGCGGFHGGGFGLYAPAMAIRTATSRIMATPVSATSSASA
jgi:hypothetical protein